MLLLLFILIFKCLLIIVLLNYIIKMEQKADLNFQDQNLEQSSQKTVVKHQLLREKRFKKNREKFQIFEEIELVKDWVISNKNQT